MSRVFLLSPANAAGRRGAQIASPAARFALAERLRTEEGAALGDVFSFMSALYFRGKLAYARRFARPPDVSEAIAAGGVLVITPNAGLRSPDLRISAGSLRGFAETAIDSANPRYREPLERSARALADVLEPECEVVLLGSVASGKYVDVLLPIFGRALVFPEAFVGRGDMSRGGLLLRCVAAGEELTYASIEGALRRGARPPKLPARTRRTAR